MVEPELPQSRALGGAWTEPPTPVMAMVPSSGVPGAPWWTLAPRAVMQARVEAQSAPVEKFEKREVP